MKRLAFVVGGLVTLLIIGSAFAQQGPRTSQLTEQEKRGKYIYLQGSRLTGKPITAFLGDGATELPATAMLCCNCHAFDGRGNPEGGVIPSDITWEALTKSYGITHASGRKHPPYTERALELAITKGIDPAGNHLPDTMPRYWMSREDLKDLVAYLKWLGKEQEPGLSETSIKVGTIVPGQGPLAEMGQAMKAALEAYFEEANLRGGIYNRRVELRVIYSSADPKAARADVERFIDGEQVFAIAGAFIAGADKELISLIEGKEVPLIGPMTLYPEIDYPLNRHIFYLFSGLKEQAHALVNFAGEKMQKQNPRIAIVSPDDGGPRGVAEAIEEQSKKRNYNSVTSIVYSRKQFDAARVVEKMSGAITDAVFFLGSSAEAAALLKEAEKSKWTPLVLIPGVLAGKDTLDAPQIFKGKIFLSFPTLPSDQTGDGAIEYRALAEKHKLSAHHLAAQISAYCAAKILVEGLRLAGKDLSREKLVRTLEGFYDFETGLTPRITYGPNRRIGALGAYIVTVDPEKKQFIPASEWIIPD